MKALIVGGTGPSGPFLASGLIQRGFQVTIFHRGTHEIPEIGPEIEHIHGDPHFRETVESALGDRTFDVVIATYGRIRFIAEALAGKTPCFIAIGGVPSYRGYFDPTVNFPTGLKVPVPEDAPLVQSEQEQRFSWLIKSTEDAVLKAHPNGVVYRYPYVYGPYQLVPREWCIIRRILDKRPAILLPDGGLSLMTHGYAENLAHAVLLAVDNPRAAAGQIYNCGDEEQLSTRQVVEVICRELNHPMEMISVPDSFGSAARAIAIGGSINHAVMDLFKIKTQLGYRDRVPAVEAIAKTAHWYVEHQPEPGGEIEQRLQDPFDYAAEDKLIAILREAQSKAQAVAARKVERIAHPYPHPKEPGLTRDHRNR
ncbi:MAG TPA: NAD-dependent epimerase/dehydratase family protein [Candidatus Binataceae bacterium]|nr:NAD-dependent epimerase/dehydratase family protein [Candidatus Binataceae bacterium]